MKKIRFIPGRLSPLVNKKRYPKPKSSKVVKPKQTTSPSPCAFSIGQIIQHKVKLTVQYLILAEPEYFVRGSKRIQSVWRTGHFFTRPGRRYWKIKMMTLRGNHTRINGKIRTRDFPVTLLKNYQVVSDIDLSTLDIDTNQE